VRVEAMPPKKTTKTKKAYKSKRPGGTSSAAKAKKATKTNKTKKATKTNKTKKAIESKKPKQRSGPATLAPPSLARIHDRLDLARWIEKFPLAAARAKARGFVEDRARTDPSQYPTQAAIDEHIALMAPKGQSISDPQDLALVEQLRREAGALDRAGVRVAVDVMVWAKGEPRHTAATKFGGVPHRPRDQPWPEDSAGRPCQFLAQICFADSRELLVDSTGRPLALPGDVLLLFPTTPDGGLGDDESIHHEWQPLELADPATADSIPSINGDDSAWDPDYREPIAPLHAQLHRTFELPEIDDEHPLSRMDQGYKLAVFESGKIGGVPFFVQHDEAPPGVFLGSLIHGDDTLFGDAGSLYLFLDRDEDGHAVVRWQLQGY
jgi:hypothetical protein